MLLEQEVVFLTRIMNEQELCKKRLIDLSKQADIKGIVTFSGFLNLNEQNIYHTSKKMFCIGCISNTKTASRLQKWHFGYKNCVSFTNIRLSIYKTAFRDTKLHLALQLTPYAIEP